MKSKTQPPAIRKFITLGLVASMSAGVLLSGHAAANHKPASREAANRSTRRSINKYPNLQRFALDLTKLARLGKLQHGNGYVAEITRVVTALTNSKMTTVLLGESNLER